MRLVNKKMSAPIQSTAAQYYQEIHEMAKLQAFAGWHHVPEKPQNQVSLYLQDRIDAADARIAYARQDIDAALTQGTAFLARKQDPTTSHDEQMILGGRIAALDDQILRMTAALNAAKAVKEELLAALETVADDEVAA